jgi:NAD(P)-dependent dehydrogenase (short-subunit alcohol dehydrogenase family)
MMGISLCLEDRVVVVTGGSRGSAWELARNFLLQGGRW